MTPDFVLQFINFALNNLTWILVTAGCVGASVGVVIVIYSRKVEAATEKTFTELWDRVLDDNNK